MPGEFSPRVIGRRVSFGLHDHASRRVEVFGDWNQWSEGLRAEAIEPGLWRTPAIELPSGRFGYKFLLDGQRWLHDPANPHKAPDGLGQPQRCGDDPGASARDADNQLKAATDRPV